MESVKGEEKEEEKGKDKIKKDDDSINLDQLKSQGNCPSKVPFL